LSILQGCALLVHDVQTLEDLACNRVEPYFLLSMVWRCKGFAGLLTRRHRR